MADVSKSGDDHDQRFLTFQSDGRLYAVPAASVSKSCGCRRWPGCLRRRGACWGSPTCAASVLPVASVRALLGRDEAVATHATRLIVLDGVWPVALAVDEVSRLVRVAGEKVRTAEADIAAETGEHLHGVFESNADIAKILDVTELLARRSSRAQPGAGRQTPRWSRRRRSPSEPTSYGNMS